MGAFGSYQNEIYLGGLGDDLPELPTDLTRLEALAQQRMPATAFGYVAGSAGSEATARANRAAFESWRIVPRMLCDVIQHRSHGDRARDDPPGTGGSRPDRRPVDRPPRRRVCCGTRRRLARRADRGQHGRFDDPRGRRCGEWRGAALVPALLAEGPRSGGELPRPRLRAGYRALVLTLDTHAMGWRPRDLDNAFLPFLRAVGNQNYLADPVFQRAVGGAVDDASRLAALQHWAATFGNPSLTWSDLAFLREHWSGPIALKGILHPDDARRAADAGMDAVVVSNHGGRQVDGAIAALDALPGVVDAVGDRIEVLFDSGIRTGADVVKALALGARSVLLGRPYVYGLALAGEDGVRHVLRCLLAELELTLALSGVTRPSDATPELVVRA